MKGCLLSLAISVGLVASVFGITLVLGFCFAHWLIPTIAVLVVGFPALIAYILWFRKPEAE